MSKLPTEQNLTIGGATYKLDTFRLPLQQEFIEWANKILGDPFENLVQRCKGFNDTMQKYMIDDAKKTVQRRKVIYDEDIKSIAATPAGIAKVMCLLFRKHNPHLSETQVTELMEKAFDEQMQADKERRDKLTEQKERGGVKLTNEEESFLEGSGENFFHRQYVEQRASSGPTQEQ